MASRLARLVALVLVGSFALPSLAAPRATQEWLAIVPVMDEAKVQQLARAFDLRGCYQGLALAVGDAADLARAQKGHPASRSLGAIVPGERLLAVTLRPQESLVPTAGVRVLDRTATQALVAVAPNLVVDLHEFVHQLVSGRTSDPFHDGVIAVPDHRMSPARGSRHQPPRFGIAAPPVPDPRVSAIVAGVTRANLDADVLHYSTNFHTRRSDQPAAIAAQNSLLARFQALGLAASLHSFDSNADNVIAEIPGALEPAKVVIVGAHYDSYTSSGATASAPGADDNGSGTAAVLELARIFAASGQPFRYTVRFCLFSSEEFGLVGSAAYSDDLVNQGVEVIAMLNTDMNAYRDPTDARDLDFAVNDTTGWLTDDLALISQLYVPSLPVVKGTLSGGTSDHRSFYFDGFPAAFYFEDLDHYSPYIHTGNDTYGTSANDFQLAELIVKSVAAGLATYAEPIDLTLVHAPLIDTADSWNPALVRVAITSNIATTPAGCDLHWDAGSGPAVAAMYQRGVANEWLGEIPAQPVGTRVRYWLEAVDSAGHTERLPRLGDLSYMVGQQVVFWSDDFESGAPGWTHGTGTKDDWMLGTPAGKSTDPAAAHSGANCWGTDLGPSGFNGEYPTSAATWLLSPNIDATGRTGVHLRYARWLGIEDGFYDQAEVRVNTILQWSNPVGGGSDHSIDDAWTLHDLDVSAQADHHPAVSIRFRLYSDGGLQFGGWNIDDVTLYSLAAGVEPELWRDVGVVSLAAGGSTQLQLNLGAAHGGRSYVVLAGISGTSPGFDLGATHVDLEFDAITQLGLTLLPNLPGFLGTLDGAGRATATLDLDPGTDPSFAGLTLHLVAVTLARSDHATPPVGIELAQ
jgi:hypothetical protein